MDSDVRMIILVFLCLPLLLAWQMYPVRKVIFRRTQSAIRAAFSSGGLHTLSEATFSIFLFVKNAFEWVVAIVLACIALLFLLVLCALTS